MALPIAAEIQYLAKKKTPCSLETELSKSQALQGIVTFLAELVGPTVHFDHKVIVPNPHFDIPNPFTLNVKPRVASSVPLRECARPNFNPDVNRLAPATSRKE